MKNVKKCICTLVLVLIMILGIFPTVVKAAGPSPYAVIYTQTIAHRKDARTVVELMNKERAKNGLNPLIFTDLQEAIAIQRGVEISAHFSHTRPDGSSCSSAWYEYGFDCSGTGENIAWGQNSAKSVMKGWMNSSGHRSNILNRSFTHVGVACVEMYGTKYWVQYFTINPEEARPAVQNATNNTKINCEYLLDTRYLSNFKMSFVTSKSKLSMGGKTYFDLAMYNNYGYPIGAVMTEYLDIENGAITYGGNKSAILKDGYIKTVDKGKTGTSTITVKVGKLTAKKTLDIYCEHKKTNTEDGSIEPAGFGTKGKINGSCVYCDEIISKSISAVKTPSLSKTIYTYTGSAIKPTVSLKNSAGKKLEEGTDYDLIYSGDGKKAGIYSITVQLKGKYEGSKVLEYKVVPKAPETAKATLLGHDDVEFTWSESKGADGYRVYYKKSSSSKYTYLTSVTETIYRIEDLSDNVKYTFKVIPYGKDGETEVYSTKQYKTVTKSTKKDIKPPETFSAQLYGHDDVKLSWSKSSGASAYKIYYRKVSESKFSRLITTTKRSYNKKSLSDGIEYVFKIVPCYGSSKTEGFYSTEVHIVTMKKTEAPNVEEFSDTEVTLNWKEIAEADGYQISKSTKKTGTNTVLTVEENSAVLIAAANKKYYYKVRGYKEVNGKKITTPWSDVTNFILEN